MTGWIASSGRGTSSLPRPGRRGSRRPSSGFARARTASPTLKNSYWDKPARRLELVEDLLKVMPAAERERVAA